MADLSHLTQEVTRPVPGASCPGEIPVHRERTQVLVIGYGNSLRRDDGLGQRVAGQLSALFTNEAEVEVTFTHQLTYDLAERVSQVQHLVLVDAAVGDTPGAISCREIRPQGEAVYTLLHHMEAAALLASAFVLYGTAPHTLLWTVVGESFEFGEALTPTVERVLPDLVAQITTHIQTLCTPPTE